MEQIITALAPFIVVVITNWLKDIKPIRNEDRKIILRFVVALLSFMSVIITSAISGDGVDTMSIQTFVNALIVFLASSGVYFMRK